MTRRRRTEVLIEGDPTLRVRLAREVRDRHQVEILEPASPGLVMLKMRESARRGLFYLGEMTTTEAKVRVAGAVGLGIIAGDEPEAALDLAIIDAACVAALPLTAGWDAVLEAADEARRREAGLEAASVLQTRVDFQIMDTE